MLRQEPKQLSLHSLLYSKIPEKHILKVINQVVDFSFINELLADRYCKNFGRPAKEPEMMCKLLFLQYLYDLSDEDVIEEGNVNLAYMYFLGINPEESLPERSLLSKFRSTRLQEATLDDIITEVVRQCVEKGIIKGTGVSFDSTHIEANTIRKTPERLMKILASKIIGTYEEETETIIENKKEAPDYASIEDHKEAKKVMKEYLEEVITQIEEKISTDEVKTEAVINKAREILDDPQFMTQTGVRSIVDEDARVGRKSKEQQFYGYKTELMMTTDERIITSVRTASGSYTDGDYTNEMIDQTISSGIEIKEAYGDKAYFRKPILDKLNEIEAEIYIPVSEVVYRIDEEQFRYNKDSDEWICTEGNITVDKKRYKSKCKSCRTGYREGYRYYFDINQCKNCPKQKECAGSTARKILKVGLNTTEFYQISQSQKTDEFKEKYKTRAAIEGKNAEIKRFHGLYRARGYGLRSVSIQSKLTAMAVNLKRIAGIVSLTILNFFYCLLKQGLTLKKFYFPGDITA